MEFEYLDRPEFKKNYLIASDAEVMDFYLENVKCSKCLAKVEGVAALVGGVKSIQLNFGNHVARVELGESGHFSEVAESWKALGFTPHPIRSRSDVTLRRKKEQRAHLNKVGVSAVLTGNIMLLYVAVYSGADPNWAQPEILCCFPWLYILGLILTGLSILT